MFSICSSNFARSFGVISRGSLLRLLGSMSDMLLTPIILSPARSCCPRRRGWRICFQTDLPFLLFVGPARVPSENIVVDWEWG